MRVHCVFQLLSFRRYDLNNYDMEKVVDDYESRDIPLDVFVLDMDWHTKDNWSGFTFDKHLFPYPEDSMAFLNAKGLYVSVSHLQVFMYILEYGSWPTNT